MSIIVDPKHDHPEYAALIPGFVAEALEQVSAGRLNVLCYLLASTQMTTALNRRGRISPRHENVRINVRWLKALCKGRDDVVRDVEVLTKLTVGDDSPLQEQNTVG